MSSSVLRTATRISPFTPHTPRLPHCPRLRAVLPTHVRRLQTSAPRKATYKRFDGASSSGASWKPSGDWRNPYSWTTRTQVLAGAGTLGGVWYVSHLEQVPETGRWRYMSTGPNFETKMAKEAYSQLAEEFQGRILPPQHPITRHVERVVNRILHANNLGSLAHAAHGSGRPVTPESIFGADDPWASGGTDQGAPLAPESGGREWRLLVVNDEKMVNAMASFGNVVVFTGILPVARDEHGLAAVLAHEIGHVVARHNSEKYSSMQVLLLLSTVVAAAFGIDFGLTRLLSTYALEYPNSRAVELEADALGLKMAARACYRVEAAPSMFERLGEVERKSGSGMNVDWLSTHPASGTRVKALEQQLPAARAIQDAAGCGVTESSFGSFRDAFSGGFSSGFGGRW